MIPTEPMKDSDGDSVILPKFVYHMYKDKAKDGTWVEGNYRTAITPNSKGITKVLTSLGWKFSTESVDPESFIGTFVEMNVDDYEYTKNSESFKVSSIKDINYLKSVEDQKEITPEIQSKIDTLEAQKIKLKESFEAETISEDGYKQGIESIDAEIRQLR